jgi:hypothetical protein
MGEWCILQMAAFRTLAVVKSLRAAGIEAWTPTATVRSRWARSRKYVDRDAALLPSFAFAPAHSLTDLLEITHRPDSGHPAFTVFHGVDGQPYVGHINLDPLREYELTARAAWQEMIEAQAREAKRKTKRSKARAYVLGQRVTVDKPAFAGLVGSIAVKKSNGDLELMFEGYSQGVTVAACDVAPIPLYCASSEQDKAA